MNYNSNTKCDINSLKHVDKLDKHIDDIKFPQLNEEEEGRSPMFHI